MAGEAARKARLPTPTGAPRSGARRLALLARASEALGASLDVEETSATLATLLVPSLADHAMIELADLDASGHATGQLRRSAMAHHDAAPTPTTPYTKAGDVVPYSEDHPATRALRSGRPSLLEHVTPAQLIASTTTALGAALVTIGVHTMLAVPLPAREGTIGVLVVCRSITARPFTRADLAIVAELAARAGIAIENARLYARERAISLTLQRSVMRERLTYTPELEAVARYVPAAGGAEVGGDWYDLIPLGGGRVGLVIGDVMGRGLTAAGTMGQLRAAARALAHVDLPPRRLLSQLDNMVTELDNQLVTCAYAIYDPYTSTLSTASAGHLPPLVHMPERRARELPVWQAVPLGVGSVPFGQSTTTLAPGTVVAFYTDGLVESPTRDLDRGIAALRGAMNTALSESASLGDAADRILGAMLRDPARHDDDVALLLVRTPRRPGPRATLQVERRASAIPNTRHFIDACLTGWASEAPIERDLVYTAILLADELVTNALRHGAGQITVRLRLGPEHLCLDVDDHGAASPEPRTAREDEEGGRGLQLVAALAESWGARPLDRGKSVWCALRIRPPHAS